MSILELDNLWFSYGGKKQASAVRGVTATFEQGGVSAVIGRSGAGKSTLLYLMSGLELPDSGSVRFDGKPTSKINLTTYRRKHVAVIYQNYRLFPLLTAGENVMYPMELRHVSKRKAREKAIELLTRVGLSVEMANRFPSTLSGGEQQRVAIARALATDAKVLLADEPTGNLDSDNGNAIIDVLTSLAHDDGYCVIIVTHDMDMLNYVDVVYKLSDGQLSRV